MVENDNADSAQEFMQEQVDKVFEFWNGSLKLPTIGPMYAFSKDFGSFANDFVTLGKVMIELKNNLDSYGSLLSTAYARAIRATLERAPMQLATREDFEKYRRNAIEAFEESFTSLFTSSEFSEVYGKLFASQLNVSRVMQSIMEKNFKTLNLPTRSEVDDILKDIVELKKTVRDMKRSVEARNDQARVAT
ncbi:MAG TPA: poly(R)-hydroxyalkanoic acid synthase subunit PhaE [Nitrososphaera sp.]|nr:poly(R)-hydroxyalkanoic acid synthase subunit PhaE [Nitrososphaera sp.]